MAAGKLKLTGFARFFLFLLIVAPSIYFGVSYYKGENGIQALKDQFGSQETTVAEPARTADNEVLINSQVSKLKGELEDKTNRINDLYMENEKLKKELKEYKTELEEVKAQLEKIKSAVVQ